VHASQDIKKDDSLLFVPRKLLLTLEDADASQVGQKIKASNIKSKMANPKHTIMACLLMQEQAKEGDSAFQPFLDILPKDIDDFPAFFSDEEKEWLDGSTIQLKIKGQQHAFENDYKLVCEADPSFAAFSLE
jgi:protein-histidine N-methyltransferase